MFSEEKFEKHPVWDRELNEYEKGQVAKIMEANPVIDQLIAETILLMPPDKLKEICDKHRTDKPKPEPARVFTEEECRGGRVLSDEEQKEVEDERFEKEQKQKEKMEKWIKEQDEKAKILEEEEYISD